LFGHDDRRALGEVCERRKGVGMRLKIFKTLCRVPWGVGKGVRIDGVV
jgi:hypothetical protein